jgi:hypothetical protein
LVFYTLPYKTTTYESTRASEPRSSLLSRSLSRAVEATTQEVLIDLARGCLFFLQPFLGEMGLFSSLRAVEMVLEIAAAAAASHPKTF